MSPHSRLFEFLAWPFLSSAVRRVRATPQRRVDQLHEGAACKLVGQVHAEAQPLIAPVSEQACVAYRVEASGGVLGDSKRIVEQAWVPFGVENKTGRVSIDVHHLDADDAWALLRHETRASHAFATPSELDFLMRHHRFADDDVGGNLHVTFTLRVLGEHERIAVVGRAFGPESRGRALGHGAHPPRRWLVAGAPDEPLLVTNDPALLA